MANRWLLTAGLGIALAVWACGARAATIDLVIDVISGEVKFYNSNASSFSITGYSIVSDPGSLDSSAGVWTSIADFYDASGDDSVDDDDEWLVLTEPGSTSDLSEGEFFGDGGSLDPGELVSLGNVWNTTLPPDLGIEVEVSQLAGLATVDVSFILSGDYNGNDIVDAADYTVWRDAFEAGATTLLNDLTPGSVGEDDFLLWRAHFGQALAPVFETGAGSGSVVFAVPEPGSAVLLLLGGLGAAIPIRRRRALRHRLQQLGRQALLSRQRRVAGP